MRDNSDVMAEHSLALSEFRLEREATLMPGQYNERLHSSHKGWRGSKPKSDNRKTRKGNVNSVTVRYNNDNNSSKFDRESPKNQFIQNAQTAKQYDYRMKTPTSFYSDQNLVYRSSHNKLHEDMKFIIENAYANKESEDGFTVKTPPQNMQIRDLVNTLDEWDSKEAIREKKYTVLPSINPTGKTDNGVISCSIGASSSFSVNNQLDFFRDKIEQDADFFVDYRVNTSKVKPTPRQQPLPPIKPTHSS